MIMETLKNVGWMLNLDVPDSLSASHVRCMAFAHPRASHVPPAHPRELLKTAATSTIVG